MTIGHQNDFSRVREMNYLTHPTLSGMRPIPVSPIPEEGALSGLGTRQETPPTNTHTHTLPHTTTVKTERGGTIMMTTNKGIA